MLIISSSCVSKMSSALDLLRSNNNSEKPYLGFSKLTPGNYEIKSFRLVQNKMYKKNRSGSCKQTVMVELEDQVLFLPEYFATNMQNRNDLIEELNTNDIKNFLMFGGKRENG